MSALVIHGGRLVDPASNRDGAFELRVDDGRITEVGVKVSAEGAKKIDARGAWVVPGLVDLRAVIQDEKDVAQALESGFTTVLAAPESPLVPQGALRLTRAAPLTRNLEGKELGDLPDGALCLSQGSKPLEQGGVLRRALQYLSPWLPLVMVHAEDPSQSGKGLLGEGAMATHLGLFGVPTSSEAAIVARDLEILRATRGRLHFAHLTCARSVELLRAAKQEGLMVSADVTPHHLTLDTSTAAGYSTEARVWPPLREPKDVAALRAAVLDGTFDAIASDHRRVDPLEREHPFDQCAPGIEAYPRLLTRVLQLVETPLRAVALLSFGPARLLGLDAGTLAPGARADLALISPERGRALLTLIDGEPAFDDKGGTW